MTIAALFVGLLLIGVPISYVLGITGFFYLAFKGGMTFLAMIPDKMFSGINSFALLAVPLFMLTGEIMNCSGISVRLMRFANMLVGHVRGGLGYVVIICSYIFAGISGSAISEVTALGAILIPTMKESGYDSDFSAALIASASVLGPIIPPSILAVVYGSMTGVSIGAIFAAAIIPGTVIAVSNFVIVYLVAKKRNYPKRETKLTTREKLDSTKEAVLAVIMPLIIIGSILTGIATPTEAAALAVLYSVFIAAFFFKTLKTGDLKPILLKTVKSSAVLLFLIGTANIFGWMLAMEQVPQKLAAGFLNYSHSPYVFLLFVIVLLLMAGCFLEITAAAILLVPILAPMASRLGIHPVHFAVVFLITDFIGVVTPPVGVCLFAASAIAKQSIEKVSKALIPFIVTLLVCVLMIAYIPWLTLFLPGLLGLI